MSINWIRFSHILTLASWFSLFALLLLWNTVLAPSSRFPTSLVLITMIGPLLFPLRGLLHGKAYTYAWSSFLIMLYFIHGGIEAWANPEERLYAILEIIFSILFYISAIMYARLKGRQNKLEASEKQAN